MNCFPDKPRTNVYIDYETFIAGSNRYDTMRLVYRFDNDPSVTQWWTESVDNEAAFSPDVTEVAFALTAVEARTLTATVTSYDGERTTATFTLRGAKRSSASGSSCAGSLQPHLATTSQGRRLDAPGMCNSK